MKTGESRDSAKPRGGEAVQDSKFRSQSASQPETLSADLDRAFK